MIDTLRSLEIINYQRQTVDTFGHLVPNLYKTYKGSIIFTLTAFGDTCIIEFDFKGLDASPWFNVEILDFISDYTNKLPNDKHYGVFKFIGQYRKTKTTCKFQGKTTEILLT